jgi:L-fuconolactonase
MTSPRIDAHHHFWDPSRYDYPWMVGPALDPVRRAFAPGDLRPVLAANGIDGTVLVQTVSSERETTEFLQIAGTTAFVRGVVGWTDLTAPGVGDALDALRDGPNGRFLVGIRHQVHDEPDPDWLRRSDVRRGLRAVAERGLSYDLLVRARELPAATETVRDLPDLRFVLDHIAKPAIAAGGDPAWAHELPLLAGQDNVSVKLSGMVTEADWGSWTPQDLRPFIEQVVTWFGPSRLIFGSDWPVCLLAASYERVLATVADAVDALDLSAQAAIFGGNAVRVYGLDDA